MTDDRAFDEQDFAKHVAQVVRDCWEHALDGPEEAEEAILEHPAVKDALRLTAVADLKGVERRLGE